MEPISISVLSQSPVPIALTWEDGSTETIVLPKLGVRGLLPWLNEQTEIRRKIGRDVIARAKLVPIDHTRAEVANARDEAVISDLMMPIQTPAGIERVLNLSMEQAKIPKDKQAKILPVLLGSGYIAVNLAQELSTLFRSMQQGPMPDTTQAAPGQQKPAGGASPLAEASSDASATLDASAPALGTTG